MSGERRGLSPADQEKLGAAMAEVFAKAREAEKFERLMTSPEAAEANWPARQLSAPTDVAQMSPARAPRCRG